MQLSKIKNKNHYKIFKRIIKFEDAEIHHRNIATVLNKPPKYLTFFFEYKNYFNNVTWYGENSTEEDRFLRWDLKLCCIYFLFLTYSRPLICHLLPQQFKLDTIFEYSKHQESIISLQSSWKVSQLKNNAGEYICSLHYFVGYYGNHYISFVLNENLKWVCYDDDKIKVRF